MKKKASHDPVLGKIIVCPEGQFWMGSSEGDGFDDEHPRHRVRISAFALGRSPVTNAQWTAVMGGEGGAPNTPVTRVSWFDAVQFCNAASRQERLEPCYTEEGELLPGADGYRLPTEAEWEYACRAGTEGEGDWSCEELANHAWFAENSGIEIKPVGEKLANPWGLHDMHGNVWEWCWDTYDRDYYAGSPAENPTGPAASPGAARVIRGGSFWSSACLLRSADRDLLRPGDGDEWTGFRCVRGPLHQGWAKGPL